MSYHRGGQTGAVAVSYSTSSMPPHSPSRRYSSGTSIGNPTTSGIGSSLSKFNNYRTTGTTSFLDRSTSFYTFSSSGLRSNYLTSEYRRSNCTGRSVSSSSYGEAGGSSNSAFTTMAVNGGNSSRYASTSNVLTGSFSSTKERSNVDTTADIVSRYSPAGYVPNIQRQQIGNSGSTHHWKYRSSSLSLNELVGGDEREVERRDLRPESSLSLSSSSSVAVIGGGLWSSRSNKRRLPTSSTVLITTGHARPDSIVSLSEVTTISDYHINHKLKDDHDDDNDIDNIKDANSDDNQYNNNGNIGIDERNGEDITCEYGINNNDNNDKNDDNSDDDDNVDVGNDNSSNDDDNLNNHHNRFCQRSYQSNEISPKRNFLFPAAGTAGDSGLISVNSLDLSTNLATNFRNTELLINNNAQHKMTETEEEEEKKKEEEVEEQKKKLENTTNNEVIHGIHPSDIPSINAIAFLQRDRNRKICEDGEDNRNNVSTTLDDNDFDNSPLIDNIAGRPSVTHGDDPSIPSTSRRVDQPVSFSVAASSNLTMSPSNVSTAHQSIYRGVNEQYVSALLKRIVYPIIVQHKSCSILAVYNY